MIIFFEGDVFAAHAQCIVNAVNCVGVMGAGLALEFKKRYPAYFADYAAKCKKGQINVGKVDYFAAGQKIFVSFPTKNHYRHNSKIAWIEDGLAHFSKTYAAQGITSVAFPKLGTGGGNLDWEMVRPLMEKYLGNLPIEVTICLNQASAPTQLNIFEESL